MSLYKRAARLADLKALAKEASRNGTASEVARLSDKWRELATPYDVKRAPAFLKWEGRENEKR